METIGGLSRSHEHSAQRLSMIREAKCLVVVVASFGGGDPIADLNGFDEDLLIADLEIVTRRIERLRESVKKPRPLPLPASPACVLDPAEFHSHFNTIRIGL